MSVLHITYRAVLAVTIIGLLLAIAGCSEDTTGQGQPVDPGLTSGIPAGPQAGTGLPPGTTGFGGATGVGDPQAGAPGTTTTPTAGTPGTTTTPTAGTPGTTTPTAGTPGTTTPTGGTPGTTTPTGGTPGTTTPTGGTPGTTIPPTGDTDFDSCYASLDSQCAYDVPEKGCTSVVTVKIPLTAGGTYGGIDLQQGPYGSYVEWNEGQGTQFAMLPNALEPTCEVFAYTFAEPAEVTMDVLDLRGQDLGLYTVFRPACTKAGETYPVITWGNGTCGQAGGYAVFLATVASYGFYIFAANNRWTGSGFEMQTALDLAEWLNDQPDTVYYQKLDFSRVGAMGHSQGGSGCEAAASDARIKSIIIWNALAASSKKTYMAVSGERDLFTTSPSALAAAAAASPLAGAWLYYHKVLQTGGIATGHLTNMEQADRVWEPTVWWFKHTLNKDPEAAAWVAGANPKLNANPAEYEYGNNGRL